MNETLKLLTELDTNDIFQKLLAESRKIINFPMTSEILSQKLNESCKFLKEVVIADNSWIKSNVQHILDIITEFGYLLQEKSKPCETEYIYEDYPAAYFMHQFDDCGDLSTNEQINHFKDGLIIDLKLYEQADTKEKMLTIGHVFAFIPCLLKT